MIIEVQFEYQNLPSDVKTKNSVLQLHSFEDNGVVFEVPEGYIGHLDDVYTTSDNMAFEDLLPGRYIFSYKYKQYSVNSNVIV